MPNRITVGNVFMTCNHLDELQARRIQPPSCSACETDQGDLHDIIPLIIQKKLHGASVRNPVVQHWARVSSLWEMLQNVHPSRALRLKNLMLVPGLRMLMWLWCQK